jgi:hypothetical protein
MGFFWNNRWKLIKQNILQTFFKKFPILLDLKYLLKVNCKQSRGFYTNNWRLLGKHEVDKNEILIMGVS